MEPWRLHQPPSGSVDVWMSFGTARSYWSSLGHAEDRLIDLWIECEKMWVQVPNNPAWYEGRLLRVDPDGSCLEILAKVRIHPVGTSVVQPSVNDQ